MNEKSKVTEAKADIKQTSEDTFVFKVGESPQKSNKKKNKKKKKDKKPTNANETTEINEITKTDE
jgi:hypothetical protein